MARQLTWTPLRLLALLLGGALLAVAILFARGQGAHAQASGYALWVVDQSNAADGGDRLYVYSSASWTEPAAVVPLGESAAAVGDGAGTRPHLLLFNNSGSHGILANVATGHVYVIRASDYAVVASIDVGEQAHGAMASPDDRWILAANQNGKRLARISADFATEQFVYDPSADLDLAALENPDQPDNAPICPVMYVGTNKAYVTLRGGGMYIVDTMATPMQVVRSYTKDEVAPAGCGGLVVGDRVYVNSGTIRDSHLYVFDAASDELLQSALMTPYGTDAHGMALVGGRYLWMANRALGDNIVVIDTLAERLDDAPLNVIDGFGAAPDLLDVSPGGDYVFVTLRGPKALTGGAGAIGETPGVAVLEVLDGGANGRLAAFLPIGDQSPESNADPHALAVWPPLTARP